MKKLPGFTVLNCDKSSENATFYPSSTNTPMPYLRVGILNSLTFEIDLPSCITETQKCAIPFFRRLSAFTIAV